MQTWCSRWLGILPITCPNCYSLPSFASNRRNISKTILPRHPPFCSSATITMFLKLKGNPTEQVYLVQLLPSGSAVSANVHFEAFATILIKHTVCPSVRFSSGNGSSLLNWWNESNAVISFSSKKPQSPPAGTDALYVYFKPTIWALSHTCKHTICVILLLERLFQIPLRHTEKHQFHYHFINFLTQQSHFLEF